MFETLRQANLIVETDIPELNRHYLEAEKGSLNLCPGLKVSYSWPRAQAVELDARGQFEADAKSRVSEALAVWGQSLA